jgi:hypothetical protein
MNPESEEYEEERWNKGISGLSDKFGSAVEKFKRRIASQRNKGKKEEDEEFKIQMNEETVVAEEKG